MLLTMGLQRGWYMSLSMYVSSRPLKQTVLTRGDRVPAIAAVIAFKITLVRTFDGRFDWYIPSEAEMAEAAIHRADARKHRLERRFGHPSLIEPLFTPMLHKNVQHLLPTIYDGRIGQSHGIVDGKEVEQNKVGGLTFNMLDEHNLQYDRVAYLRQRDDDEQSISTALGPGGGKEDYIMAGRRADYLRNGPASTIGRFTTDSPGATPADELGGFDFGRVHTNQSQDALISYPPSYATPPGARPGTQSPAGSQVSLDYYAGAGGRSGRTTPGADGMYGYTDPGRVVEYVQQPMSTPPRHNLPAGAGTGPAAPVPYSGAAPAPYGSRTPPFGPVVHSRDNSVVSLSSSIPPASYGGAPSYHARGSPRPSVDLGRVAPAHPGYGRRMSVEQQYAITDPRQQRPQPAQVPPPQQGGFIGGGAGPGRMPYSRLDTGSTDDITRQSRR